MVFLRAFASHCQTHRFPPKEATKRTRRRRQCRRSAAATTATATTTTKTTTASPLLRCTEQQLQTNSLGARQPRETRTIEITPRHVSNPTTDRRFGIPIVKLGSAIDGKRCGRGDSGEGGQNEEGGGESKDGSSGERQGGCREDSDRGREGSQLLHWEEEG